MEEKLKKIILEAQEEIASVKTTNELLDKKAKYLGKKSEFNDLMQELKNLPNDQKPLIGKLINEAKQNISSLIDEKKKSIDSEKINALLEAQKIDITLPGKNIAVGHRHVLNKTVEEIEDIFISLGYEIKE